MIPQHQPFDWEFLAKPDYDLVMQYLGHEREPDVTIAPDGTPYIYRWWLKQRDTTGDTGNLYLHIQVADDPERPLHDHPWDNMSVILSGGYDETMFVYHPTVSRMTRHLRRRAGDVVFRKAAEAHHLKLLPGEPYTITQFATGPYIKPWGFYGPAGWFPFTDAIHELPDGRSIYEEPKR